MIDVLYDFEKSESLDLASRRIHTKNTHGTGCSLSSALASFLAKGHSLADSALLAKAFITESIKAGSAYEIGQGHGSVNHFYQFGK